jgi:hypothetical protein
MTTPTQPTANLPAEVREKAMTILRDIVVVDENHVLDVTEGGLEQLCALFAVPLSTQQAEAAADKARLDWLADNITEAHYKENLAGNLEPVTMYDLSRSAIDAAVEVSK